MLRKIENQNQYQKFKTRFIELTDFIFSDDLIILVKDELQVDLYLVEGKDFTKLLKEKCSTPENFITIINRWEGNSIRMNRVPIFEIGKRITLDFNFLDNHIINQISKTEQKLSEYFIQYVNSYPKNLKYKDLIFTECDTIIKKIDISINDLI